MSPEQTFRYINSFLSHIAPIISHHYGFIDKYTGDRLMAIFPREDSYAYDADLAGIAIFINLNALNLNRQKQSEPEIEIGVGIHSGPTMLGIIGENLRYEGTVVSDAVNTTAKIEALTKQYNQYLIISETIKQHLPANINLGITH